MLDTSTCHQKNGKVSPVLPSAGDRGPAGAAAALPLAMARWREMLGGGDWQEALREGITDAQLKEIRRFTTTGRPLGSDSFVSKLETALGRRLRALPVGRPRKKTNQPRKKHGKQRSQNR